MAGYAKVFSSILTSTIWGESHATRIVWLAMLASADAHGVVEGSVPGFAHAARVTREEMEKALAKLMAPDPDSRSKEFEGRRIEAIDGGWRILNHAKYRERGAGGEGSRAPYMREWRKRRKERDRAEFADRSLTCPDCAEYPCVCGPAAS